MAIGILEHHSPWETDHKTYNVFFYNDSIFTTVTHNSATVSVWISEAKLFHQRKLHRFLVALDVKYPPSNIAAATLQLCVGGRCLIYQIGHSTRIPQSLADFLSDNYNIFVGVDIKSDLEKLKYDYGIGGKARYMDLRELAANVYNRSDFRNAGLETLAAELLGKEVGKPNAVAVNGWNNRWLTAEQVQYACVDAFVCFDIGRILNATYRL